MLPTLHATLLCLTLAADSQPVWMIEFGKGQAIDAELTFRQQYLGQVKVKEWTIVVPQPPELPGQSKIQATLEPRGKPEFELGPMRRPMLRSQLNLADGPYDSGIEVKVRYRATLWPRRLVPLPPGNPPGLIGELSAEDRAKYLASAGLCDHASSAFNQWLDAARLRRNRNEDEVAFARRVFRTVARTWSYGYQPDQDRRVSRLVGSKQTDCGGLSLLVAAALRANQVPARVLAGRWAESARSGETVGGLPYFQTHVMAEFHARGIGWVPVDPASAVLHDKSPDGQAYFGNDPGKFLTMHVDTDVVASTMFGPRTVPWMQGVAFWGKLSDPRAQGASQEQWVVRKIR